MQIVATVGIVSAISGVLAFLITLANKTVNDYGDVTININDTKNLEVRGGSTLLSLLIDNEVFIPSACGGKGSCGFCKCKVIDGAGPVLPTERGYVTPEEEKEGIRLSCQVKVKNDIHIEIDEELFNVKQYDYQVEDNELITPTIKHLVANLPQGKEIDFKPGQYIQLMAPKYEGNKEEAYRAYSVASSPSKKNQIELLIGFTNGGVATTYVHKYLQKGDKVRIVGPYGDFYYHDSDREMVMIAIGTGMAPILSILRYMKENNLTQRKATFYFGAKTRDELMFTQEFAEIEKALPNFKFVPVLSREKEDWTGERGRVTDMIEKYLDHGESAEAYLCGSPKMIDSVVELLEQKGMAAEHIYYDKFS